MLNLWPSSLVPLALIGRDLRYDPGTPDPLDDEEMAIVYTNDGADRLFKGGLVGGGVEISLHTGAPPTNGNEITDSWYSAQTVDEADWSPETAGTYRELNNNDDINFGTTPATGSLSDAECVAIRDGSTYLWYDDTPSVDIQNNRNVKIDSGNLRLQINKSNAAIP